MKKDLLTLFDLTRKDLDLLFEETDRLRHDRSVAPLRGQTVAMIFQKPSLRTRVSFEVGVSQLGGHTTFLSQESIGIGTRESVHDVALLLSRYCGALVARLFDHRVLVDLARFATIPVINALTDLSHPCQVLADLYTVRQYGKLKPGVTVAFIGDGNNVANSWLEISGLYPIRFILAAPKGYQADPGIVQRARAAGVSSIEIVADPQEAVRNADVVYTDVWTSMGQEAEAERRRKAFTGYQVSEALMRAAPADCLVMHCLPAHRGEEITDAVIDGPRSVVFDQAENRLHVQKAVLTALCSQNHGDQAQGAER
ncbi:MAG: ornithine carbamoyltransferase [Bacteroidia bacterium]|nr:MAG: ornithine carbamoyltransferase [Bacteroidia bacterium]